MRVTKIIHEGNATAFPFPDKFPELIAALRADGSHIGYIGSNLYFDAFKEIWILEDFISKTREDLTQRGYTVHLSFLPNNESSQG